MARIPFMRDIRSREKRILFHWVHKAKFALNSRRRARRCSRYGTGQRTAERDFRTARTIQLFEQSLQRCAKDNSFKLVRRIESCANGEGRERASGNQGWGLGTFSLPSRQDI